jgi:biotin operon repressor
LERELDWVREELERKRRRLAVLRNESAHSGRELAKETEINRGLRAQVDRLQIGLQIEEGKQALKARMKRRHPFFHAPGEASARSATPKRATASPTRI